MTFCKKTNNFNYVSSLFYAIKYAMMSLDSSAYKVTGYWVDDRGWISNRRR